MTRCSCAEDVVCGACMTGAAADPTTPDDVREALRREVNQMLSSVASHGPAALTTTIDRMYTTNLLRRLRDALPEVRPRGTVAGTEVQALTWSAGYEAGAEDQANVEGHRYTLVNTADMVVTPNPYCETGVHTRGTVTDAEVEAAAQALFEDPLYDAKYTWAEMVAEDPSRADIWREDARRVLAAVEAARLS